MKSMGDYHDHYFKKDVFLSADVFEKFIDRCLKFYKLDPCQVFLDNIERWREWKFCFGVL